MTTGDAYTKQIISRILEEGTLDVDPRPHYSDGTPAHTLSVNHGMCTYDLSKGESPLITLRPIAIKKAIGEILWIYQVASNDVRWLQNRGVKIWKEWEASKSGEYQGKNLNQIFLI